MTEQVTVVWRMRLPVIDKAQRLDHGQVSLSWHREVCLVVPAAYRLECNAGTETEQALAVVWNGRLRTDGLFGTRHSSPNP